MSMRLLVYIVISLLFVSCAPTPQEENTMPENSDIRIGERVVLYSDVLGEEREVFVYVPEGFYGMDEQNLNYPVAYVMDGESQFMSTVGMLQQMSSPYSANDMVPQMLVVGVVNTNRDRDLTPTKAMVGRDSSSLSITGGADQMALFLKKELIPFVNETYPASNHRVLIGHSLGGLFALNTLIKFPHLFQNYLAIDPFLSWDKQKFSEEVSQSLLRGDYSGKSLYVATANNLMSWMELEDALIDTTEVMQTMQSTLVFKNKLAGQEMKLDYRNDFYTDENHFQIPILGTYEGFKYLYRYYTFPQMIEYYYPRLNEPDLVAELKLHYREISKELGYTVLPLESYINSWAYGFAKFDRNDLALKLFEMNRENYEDSPNVHASLGFHSLAIGDTLKAIEYFKTSLEIKELSHVRKAFDGLNTN
ncbi:MAG: alpha/beta hydrolase-fold protein [Saprospiraceae bacterium]|nr:alpha/beta hydrolase-fold protein [Saprospiraceae bacterium]